MIKQKTAILNLLVEVHKVLNPTERKRAFLLMLGILLNGVVEVLGLAIIVPIIGLVIDPNGINEHDSLASLYRLTQTLGIQTAEGFIVALCLLLIVAFSFKAVFGLWLQHTQSRFSLGVALRISSDMWSHHFSKSVVKLQSANTGRLVAEINNWPLGFASTFMIGSLLMFSELFVVIIISLGLLIYNPVVCLSVGILLALGTFLIRKVTRRKLARFSDIKKKLEPQSVGLITDAIRGYIEILTFQAERFIKSSYLERRSQIFDVDSGITVLNLAPSKLYELLAVMIIALSIVVSLVLGTPSQHFLEILSVLAISAYRVMPSMSRVNGAIMQMRAKRHVMNAIQDMHSQSPHESQIRTETAQHLSGPIGIELNNISVFYDNSESAVVNNLTWSFAPGKMHAIVGKSGSGKSTLLHVILGLIQAQKGTVSISDATAEKRDLGNLAPSTWLAEIGFLGQHPFFFSGSVKDNMIMRGAENALDQVAFNAWLMKLGLDGTLGTRPLEFQLNEGGSNLSGGQLQRLAVIRTVLKDSSVFILDEATSALDDKSASLVMRELQHLSAQGSTIIIVTHDEKIAGMCDSILDLSNCN